jgi:hypothetical protein
MGTLRNQIDLRTRSAIEMRPLPNRCQTNARQPGTRSSADGSTPGTTMPEATSHRAYDEGIQKKHNAAARSHRCEKVAAPSPIRTLPSVPEFHRIMRVARHPLADCYRRSGLDRHKTRSHPNPEGCASHSVVMAAWERNPREGRSIRENKRTRRL